MNKSEFLKELEKNLSSVSADDAERSLEFYLEMINDLVENGMSEEEAVASLGSAADIAEKIIKESAPVNPSFDEAEKEQKEQKVDNEKAEAKTDTSESVKKSFPAWAIVLLILGFPVWFPLLTAAAVTLLSLYIVIWSVDIVFYSASASIAAVALASLVNAPISLGLGSFTNFIFYIGAAVSLSGISIFAFMGSGYFTKLIIYLTNRSIRLIKRIFKRGEN